MTLQYGLSGDLDSLRLWIEFFKTSFLVQVNQPNKDKIKSHDCLKDAGYGVIKSWSTILPTENTWWECTSLVVQPYNYYNSFINRGESQSYKTNKNHTKTPLNSKLQVLSKIRWEATRTFNFYQVLNLVVWRSQFIFSWIFKTNLCGLYTLCSSNLTDKDSLCDL